MHLEALKAGSRGELTRYKRLQLEMETDLLEAERLRKLRDVKMCEDQLEVSFIPSITPSTQYTRVNLYISGAS